MHYPSCLVTIIFVPYQHKHTVYAHNSTNSCIRLSIYDLNDSFADKPALIYAMNGTRRARIDWCIYGRKICGMGYAYTCSAVSS